MNIIDLQKAIGTKADGIWGEDSRKALLNAFTCNQIKSITDEEEELLSKRLNTSVSQLRAVASVESSGGGYDKQSRPKILFERHKFHKYTGGRYSVCAFSSPKGGGYNESSWNKLLGAIVTGAVDAAFMACSWGKFQVLGEYWDDFGFSSPFEMAFSTVSTERAHYDLLCHYVEMTKLQDEMGAISSNPETCRDFAKGYNGKNYAEFAYHKKLAAAMK